MDELYAILLSWAVTLSVLPPPDDPPVVMRVPHGVLVQVGCELTAR